jgi:hypothetical protein
MKHFLTSLTPMLALTLLAVFSMPAFAMNMSNAVTMTKVSGPYRIELQLLPAEPFFTKAQYEKEHPKDGMLVVGGATPLAPDAPSHPNHHLIVHVFDKATGKAVTTATVTITYASASGPARDLPIVEMQAIGKGPQSTHYGNNVYLTDGTYTVTVTANGNTTTFSVAAKSAAM